VAHFFHRQPLELAGRARLTLKPRQGAAAQLLGALRGNVDKQETAVDGLSPLGRFRGSFSAGSWCYGLFDVGHV
jgi:hypothetical protein